MPQIIDLGKIRFSYKGTYDLGTQYQQNDVVSYGANAYVYTSTTASTGNAPTNTSYWSVMTSGLQFESAWSASASYQVNDIVKFGPKAYVAIQDASGQDPTNASYWEVISDGIGHTGDWSDATTYYYPGDIVTRGGSQYIALTYHEPTSDFATDLADGDWEEFGRGLRFRGLWQTSTAYLKDDIITDSLDSYVAQSDFTSNSVSFANETAGRWSLFTPGTDVIPAQAGNANGLLTTDGSDTFWTPNIEISGSASIYANPFLNGPSATFATETASLNPNASAYLLPEYGLEEIPAGLTNPIAFFSFNSSNLANSAVNSEDDYAQFTVQNFSQGEFASTDIIANADIGDDETGWIDMGITSTNFYDPDFTITGAHDGYIFMSAPIGTEGDGNLVFATDSTGQTNAIVFAAGGLTSNATQMTIIPDTQVHIEIATESTSPTTGALAVAGGVGVSGNANILGDVFINGSLQVSGGAFETETLVSSAPLFVTGTGATDDLPDRGFLTEYKGTSASASFPIDLVSASGGIATVRRKQYTTLTKAVSSNTATIVIQEPEHDIVSGETVTFTGLGSPYDGTFTITGTTTTSMSYEVVASNQGPTADTDGIIAPHISDEFIVGDRVTISDSDVSELNGNRDFVTSFTNTTLSFDFNGTIAQTSASGTVLVDSKTYYTGLVRNTVNDEWYFIDKYPTLASGSSRVAPSDDIDFSLGTLEYPKFNVGGLGFTGSSPEIGGNPTFSGTPTFSGDVVFSASASLGAGGVLSGTFAGNPTFTGNVVYSGNPVYNGDPIFNGTAVFSGGVRVQEMIEDVVDTSHSGNGITASYADGNIFWLTNTPTANMTLNITNVPTDNGRIVTVNLFVTQGATGYYPAALQIDGVGQTIKWPQSTAPIPTSQAGAIDVFTFNLIRRGSSWTVIGNANVDY